MKGDSQATRQARSGSSSLRTKEAPARSKFGGRSDRRNLSGKSSINRIGSDSISISNTGTSRASNSSSRSKKKVVNGCAASSTARTPTISSTSDGWLRPSGKVSTACTASSVTLDGDPGEYTDFREPFMDLLDVVQRMEADIALLRTANKKQAKELGDLQSQNEQLRCSHAQLTKSQETFSSSVVEHLKVVEAAIAQGFQQATQIDTRVERYMDSVERMADDVGDKLHRLNLRADTLAAGIESVRIAASTRNRGVTQAELRREMDGMTETVLTKNEETTLAFEALLQHVSELTRPAASSALELDAACLLSPSSQSTVPASPSESEQGECHEGSDPPRRSSDVPIKTDTLSSKDGEHTISKARLIIISESSKDRFGATLAKAARTTSRSEFRESGGEGFCSESSTVGILGHHPHTSDICAVDRAGDGFMFDTPYTPPAPRCSTECSRDFEKVHYIR